MIHHTDLIDIDADPEEINEAFIVSAITENIDSVEDNNYVTDKLSNGSAIHKEHDVKNVHFNVAQWEDTDQEEILWLEENP